MKFQVMGGKKIFDPEAFAGMPDLIIVRDNIEEKHSL